jgi:hypothetical protein
MHSRLPTIAKVTSEPLLSFLVFVIKVSSKAMRCNPYYTMAVSNMCACLRDGRVAEVDAEAQLKAWLESVDQEIEKLGDPTLLEVNRKRVGVCIL